MARPSIVGTGSAVPETARTNDDPIFDWLRANPPPGQDLFAGYEERRVLVPGERITDLMVAAAKTALQKSSVAPADVDVLLGFTSVSTWEMPNDLVVVAQQLGLSESTPIVPVNNEYANFNESLLLADALVTAGRASRALIVVGANWSRYVDYRTAPAISAADGAGAAVVATSADATLWSVQDRAVAADWSLLGGMYMTADPTSPPLAPPTFHAPVFHLNQEGIQAFKTFGVPRPPMVVGDVLARNGLTQADAAFVGHQTSLVINTAWQQALPGIQFIQTLTTYANMTSASIPVNLDTCAGQITRPNLVLVALGPEPSCNVVLLQRQAR
jgi:3-oxoacyl-[acyl-carrier-protein] synthase-3